MKKQKTAGVQLKRLMELKQYLLPLTMPSSLNLLLSSGANSSASVVPAARRLLYIPLDDVYEVEGACLTGPMQIQWIGQLTQMSRKFVLHADSKFKLHHGEWVLTTIGVHWLRWDAHHHTLTTSFAPLVYLMCKQHESLGACKMLMDALNYVSLKYYGCKLQPGACMSDHADGFRAAYGLCFPGIPFGQCWPHIARKWSQGEYASKKWEHFDEVKGHLQAIHMAHTPEMRDLLMKEIGDLWDSWGRQMDVFWNSYCVKGWDNWSIGLFDCMLCTPSQQAQESWHKQLLLSKIPGMIRGSTEMVFHDMLPDLIEQDAIQIPSELVFHVPAVPKGMITKALWYVDHHETHIWATESEPGVYSFFFLRKDQTTGLKRISQRLIELYKKASQGTKDPRITDLEYLTDVCGSMHLVADAHEDWGVPQCELNPGNFDCLYCKGFKGHGICSHVLAINHITKRVNLRREMMEIGKSNRKHTGGGGNQKKALPALTRAPTCEPDSSDEEQERLLEQGDNGM